MAYDPKTNYDIGGNGPIKGWNSLYWNGGFNDNWASLACDTFNECQGYVLDNNGSMWLEGAARRAGNSANQKNGDKKNPRPAVKYTGKPITAATSVQYGAKPQDSANGSNCGGFNGYGDWKGKPLQGFGANYNGQCPSSFILSYCPPEIGRPVAGNYANKDGGVCNNGGPGCSGGSLTSDLLRKCDYSSMNMEKFISAGIFDENLGKTILNDVSWTQAKNDYCAKWENIDKQACVNWLNPSNAGASSYSAVKMGLCMGTPGGDWSTDTRCVNAINQVYKTGSDADKGMANQMVNTFCGTNPEAKACACYNATNRTVDQCLATPELPGCKSISEKVGKYKSLGATFMTTALKPFCACDECTIAKTGSSGTVISQPAADQPGLCTDKINACFQQVTVGSMSGGNLTAGCTIQDINPPTAAPTQPAALPTAAPIQPAALPAASAAKPAVLPTAAPIQPAVLPAASAAKPAGGPVGGAPVGAAPSTTPSSGNKNALIGGGVGLFCLLMILLAIGLFFMMKKKPPPVRS